MSSASIFMPRNPALLALCLALAGIVAFSIHVGMLALGVPFPLPRPTPLWVRWLDNAVSMAGTIAFLRLAQPHIGHLGPLARTLIAAAILLAIQETLRAASMSGVVTGGWAASTLGLVRPLLQVLIFAGLAVLAARWVRGAPSLVVGALLAAAVYVMLHLVLAQVLAPLTEQVAALGRPSAYAFPYPFHVTLLAYVTFIEPVIGATVLTALVWNRLPAPLLSRLAVLALLTALLKGIVGRTALYSFFLPQPPLTGLLAYSQFLLEFLALGALVGLAWHLFGQRRAS